MSPADLIGRLLGLLVAVAGGSLVWGGLLTRSVGARGIDLLARGDVANVAVAGGLTGLAFVFAGLAVLVARGRSVAVSVGGGVLVATVCLLAVGTESTTSVLGIGVLALALFFAGASVRARSAP